MHTTQTNHRHRRGHSLMELMVAMAASTFLVAGMGSVIFIARQIAFTPSESSRRSTTADIVAQMCDELRYSTYVIQNTSKILEFVVADRNGDGTAEKIRYEWSGTVGAPLYKTINGGTSVELLPSVTSFSNTFQQTSKTSTYTTTVDSSEQLLWTTASPASSNRRDIDASTYMSQSITPSSFSSIPANVLTWNLTKLEVYARQNSSATETLAVQVRTTGDPYDSPTGKILGSVAVAESALTSSDGWNTITFASPIRDLTFSRRYALVLAQSSGSGQAARIPYADSTGTGVNDSTDAGASWQYLSTRQMYAKFYGTYTTPGTSYIVTRNYISYVRIALQTGTQGYSRVDASAPLRNSPELLSSYTRTDFDRDPSVTNGNGDSVADWAVTGNTAFDTTKLVSGIWTATGAIETRPLADFTTTTTVEARCRNTSVGGNGAVLSINADRQSGVYAPLLVYVTKQADGTQTLTLSGKTSELATKQLFSRTNLGSGFVRFQLTVLPAHDLVNIQISGEDQGTYTYPTYAPSSTTDGYLTVFAVGSTAEFDYVDLRVGTN